MVAAAGWAPAVEKGVSAAGRKVPFVVEDDWAVVVVAISVWDLAPRETRRGLAAHAIPPGSGTLFSNARVRNNSNNRTRSLA